MIQMAIRQASGLMLNLDDPKHQPVAAKQVALEDVGVKQTAVTVMMAAVVGSRGLVRGIKALMFDSNIKTGLNVRFEH